MSHYIGIAGFTSAQEICYAIDCFRKHVKNPHYALAIGILASRRTLAGETNKYPNRYPTRDRLQMYGEICAHELDVMPVLHYSTDTLENIEQQMRDVREVMGDVFPSVQVNLPLHLAKDPAFVQAFAVTFCEFRPPLHRSLILQLRSRRAGDPLINPVDVAAAHERGEPTDLLIDASGGTGLEIDTSLAAALIASIRAETKKRYRIGIAGGLNPHNVHRLGPLMSMMGPLNFDVESGVRCPTTDTMERASVDAFLREAGRIVNVRAAA